MNEFSSNPIKIHLVDIKKASVKTTYIFAGNVEDGLRKDLERMQAQYNKSGRAVASPRIVRHYSKNWRKVLGLLDNSVKRVGSALSETTKSIADGGADLEDFGDFAVDEALLQQMDELLPEIDTISAADIRSDSAAIDEFAHIVVEEKADLERADGRIEFIFDTVIYPIDKVSDFKLKIFAALKIPLYRQHIWYKYNGKSHPLSYNFYKHDHLEYIDIEYLYNFYNGTNKMDQIEGVPVNMIYYSNKDFLRVEALDTTVLMQQLYERADITNFFLADLNSILDKNAVLAISKDRYQIELIYYGFIVLYFPMLTTTVFLEYLKNEKGMADMFPDLLPSPAVVTARLKRESDIVNEIYDIYDDKSAVKKISRAIHMSIISTKIGTTNYKQQQDNVIIIRNLFDFFRLNTTITYCKARILHENQTFVLKKSYFNEPDFGQDIVLNSCAFKMRTNFDTTEHMIITIFKNGNYQIQTEWHEENHMNFDKITAAVLKKINPFLEIINSLGSRVFYTSRRLPLFSRKNIMFTNTTVTFYYESDMTNGDFSVIKSILNDFKAADIITPKENVMQSPYLEFFFTKGMYQYDSNRITKTISVDNYYEYLSSSVIKQKWSTLFERTRLMQVSHISSSLRVYISGLRDDIEMNIFSMFLVGLVHIYERTMAQRGFAKANKSRHARDLTEMKQTRALKNLKAQDPLLYDFKKIYKSDVIYSKICQKPYQPVILSDQEYAGLSKDRRGRAVKYWNFTKQKPVWYSCPNPKFPYIKYIIKQHPKDFCIPCCKKIEMNEKINIKKQEIHNTCMRDHIYAGEKVNLTKGSHYIMTYGKDIEPGRLSRLPEATLEPLFFDTYSPDGSVDQECITAEGYYLLGMEQNMQSVANVGYLYCLTFSLIETIDDFLLDCVRRIRAEKEHFDVLYDGRIMHYFTSVADLCDALVELRADNIVTARKIHGFDWNILFRSIAYYYYGINTILFADQKKNMIEMILPPGLTSVDDMFPDTHKHLLILQKRDKYYPIYLINTEIYKRVGAIDTRLFTNEHGIIAIVKAVVRRHMAGQNETNLREHIDLPMLNEFLKKKGRNYSITHYFINNSNLCYGVYVRRGTAGLFLPLSATHYSLNKNIEMNFAPFKIDNYSTNIKDLLAFLREYNNWAKAHNADAQKKAGGAPQYPLIRVENWLRTSAGAIANSAANVFGFLCANLNYYFNSISEKTALALAERPLMTYLYHPERINKMLDDLRKDQRLLQSSNNAPELNKSLYNYYLFQLVYLEFMQIFNGQKNKELRKKLYRIIMRTDFGRGDTDDVRNFISHLEDRDDQLSLKNILSNFIKDLANGSRDKKPLIDSLEQTMFNFDKMELEKLKKSSKDVILRYLQRHANGFVKIGQINARVDFPDNLILCSGKTHEDKPGYCAGSRLIIEKKKLEEILDVIAIDIMNPLKWKWLFNPIFVNRSVNFFRFLRHAGESITIEFI